jgi:TrmH family RNA methyltransferase
VISEKEMSAISALKTAPGILAVAKKKPSSGTLAGNKILLLDNLKDPGNLGTIIRSAEWFGISDIILNSECVEEFNPKVIQSTMGSIFRMNIERCSLPEKISDLKERGIQIYGADMEGDF